MCIVAAKYFPGQGWAGAKNRDRNYVPDLTFDLLTDLQPHRLLMRDDMTGYMEGLNAKGIAVLSASLQVMDDEKEIKKRTRDDNPDGERIREALKNTTLDRVVKELVNEGMTGNTLIFDQERCFILEGANFNDQYKYKLEEVDPNTGIARTNHGILLPQAGYQRGVTAQQDESRASSEARLKAAEAALVTAQTPDQLVDLLAEQPNKNTQMNPLRTTTDHKRMRTTAQELIIPQEHTFFLRPIQSKLDIDFWRINQTPDDLWLEILSNRIMRKPKDTNTVDEEETDPFTRLGKIYGSVKPQDKGMKDLFKTYGRVQAKL